MIMKYHQARGRHRLPNRQFSSLIMTFRVRMSENGNKNEKPLNFWWDDLLWKEQSERGLRPQTRPRLIVPSSQWKMLLLSFDWFQSKILTGYKSLSDVVSHQNQPGSSPKGDKLWKNYKTTKVGTCSVFKAPDFIRFLIRNKCPHQCRIKCSSHTEWIQNVKMISIDSSMSGT